MRPTPVGRFPHLRKPHVVAALVLLMVAALVAGVASGGFASVSRRGLYATGLWTDGGASTLPLGAFSTPASPRTPAPEPQGAPPAVLKSAKAGPAPERRRVAAKVTGVDRGSGNGSYSAAVVDEGTGKVLYAKDSTKAYIPASTLKLLTAAAALSILGPQHQFTTSVVSSARGRITLVGGGDPYLVRTAPAGASRASLSGLASLTAAALKRSGVSTVKLDYDVSLFSGPGWHPDWPDRYRDQVTPISALWVNEGRPAGSGPRQTNPAKSAAADFATELKARGIRVSAVREAEARKGSAPMAAVRSLPLDQIVEHLLLVSDNDAAEVVARQAAIGSGRAGSFNAAQAAVRARLTKLDVWQESARIRDGSGLSRGNRVPAGLLARLMHVALQPSHPELRAVVTGLPVAGVEGSLRQRFTGKGATAGRGLVRAKTGNLTGVSALAGYVRTDDGSLLTYAFLVNDSTDFFGTRAWLDRVVSALSTCGCRKPG